MVPVQGEEKRTGKGPMRFCGGRVFRKPPTARASEKKKCDPVSSRRRGIETGKKGPGSWVDGQKCQPRLRSREEKRKPGRFFFVERKGGGRDGT